MIRDKEGFKLGATLSIYESLEAKENGGEPLDHTRETVKVTENGEIEKRIISLIEAVEDELAADNESYNQI